MELMIPYYCPDCDLVNESKFSYAGPHIKQTCSSCDRYVKFFPKHLIPDVKEIKLKIWAICPDVEKLNELKKSIGYISDLKGVDAKLIEWKLYLRVKKEKELEASV